MDIEFHFTLAQGSVVDLVYESLQTSRVHYQKITVEGGSHA
jgi:hypothetical protein